MKMKAICLRTIMAAGGGLFLLLGASPPPPAGAEISELGKRINAFTFDVLRQSAGGEDAAPNTILSPQSIYHGLAMNYVASGGETRKELAETCHFPDDNQELLEGLTELRGQLHAGAKHERVDMSMANSMWLDETYADFREEYQKLVQEAFAASLHRVKFAQKEAVSTEINRWIAGKTRGKIQEGVAPEDFDSRSGGGVIDEPGMVSVNAIYFKADWGSRFDVGASRNLPFHVDASREVEAMMMHQSSLLNYSENDEAKFLEIPYIDEAYSMYVILPKETLGVKALMDVVTPSVRSI